MDHSRNNKVAFRNFTEHADFHDLVKTQLFRMIRREHKRAYICSEHNPERPNEDYPDILMQQEEGSGRKRRLVTYVWEIQWDDSEEWKKQIQIKHADSTLIIVPLKEIKKAWNRVHWCDNLTALRDLLKPYVL